MHYALRVLIHAAADHADLDPDRISFTKAMHAARRSIRTGLTEAVTLPSAVLDGLLPKRDCGPTPVSCGAR